MGIPKLAFPHDFRAPQFTPDFADTLEYLAGPRVLELFCRTRCRCLGEPKDEMERAEELLRVAEKRLVSISGKGQPSTVSKKRPQGSESEGRGQSSGKKRTYLIPHPSAHQNSFSIVFPVADIRK
jgi:hypothetical protein